MTAAQYTLSRSALRECVEIVSYLHREAGANVATKIESRLFQAFADLASGRSPGHRRSDLTVRDIFFYEARPYMILFKRTARNVHVVRVLHESRDLKSLL